MEENAIAMAEQSHLLDFHLTAGSINGTDFVVQINGSALTLILRAGKHEIQAINISPYNRTKALILVEYASAV